MGQEIERKFLLKNDGWRGLARGALYRQGDHPWEIDEFCGDNAGLIIALLVPWTHYAMPLMGFNSRLW